MACLRNVLPITSSPSRRLLQPPLRLGRALIQSRMDIHDQRESRIRRARHDRVVAHDDPEFIESTVMALRNAGYDVAATRCNSRACELLARRHAPTEDARPAPTW
jgi:hypothetical protein